MKALASSCIVLAFLGSTSLQSAWQLGSREQLLTPSGRVVKLASKKYRATLVFSPTTAWSPEERAGLWGAGETALGSPEVPIVLTLISMRTSDGRRIYVPRSAFADLAEVHTAELRDLADGAALLLHGADASESYRAMLRIRGLRVVERTVRWASFPDHFYEKTIYVSKTPPDE